MCIFRGPVERVSNTRILVTGLHGHGQLVVYENQVKAAQPVAMILPCPVGDGDGDITVYDTTACRDSFDRLESILFPPEEIVLGRGGTRGLGPKSAPHRLPLPIERIGSYDVSIAHSLADLDRLDWSTFDLDPALAELLGQHYAQGFGFVVAKIVPDKPARPLAFSCSKAADGSLFVPTRHYHGDPNPQDSSVVDWDHTIYVCNGVERPAEPGVTVRRSATFVDPTTYIGMLFAGLPLTGVRVKHVDRLRITQDFPVNDDLCIGVEA